MYMGTWVHRIELQSIICSVDKILMFFIVKYSMEIFTESKILLFT